MASDAEEMDVLAEPQVLRYVTFVYETTLELHEHEIWPDGDAPPDWTINDVAAVIEKCGGAHMILRDWDLDGELTLDIIENGESLRVP